MVACTLLACASASPLVLCSVSLARRLPKAEPPYVPKTTEIVVMSRMFSYLPIQSSCCFCLCNSCCLDSFPGPSNLSLYCYPLRFTFMSPLLCPRKAFPKPFLLDHSLIQTVHSKLVWTWNEGRGQERERWRYKAKEEGDMCKIWGSPQQFSADLHMFIASPERLFFPNGHLGFVHEVLCSIMSSWK